MIDLTSIAGLHAHDHELQACCGRCNGNRLYCTKVASLRTKFRQEVCRTQNETTTCSGVAKTRARTCARSPKYVLEGPGPGPAMARELGRFDAGRRPAPVVPALITN